MSIIRFEPFRELDTLQREMNRLFDNFTPPIERSSNGVAFMPAAEIYETPEAIHLKVEIPGNDQVEAEYKDGILQLNLPKAEAEKNRVVKVSLG